MKSWQAAQCTLDLTAKQAVANQNVWNDHGEMAYRPVYMRTDSALAWPCDNKADCDRAVDYLNEHYPIIKTAKEFWRLWPKMRRELAENCVRW